MFRSSTRLHGLLLVATIWATPPVATAQDVEARIDNYLAAQVQKRGDPWTDCRVVRGGRVIYAGAHGVRRLGDKEKLTPQHVFHFASVSKPFVATAFMQLVERGKLSLDDRVTTSLPYFTLADKRFGEITIRHMLNHTSGMPDVEDYEWDKPQSDEGAAERFVRAMASERLLWAPGGGWRYSNNMAFDALGDVIAKVSGQSFETYVRANILEPLGMKNSSFIHAEIGEALRTTGHVGNPARVSAVYPYNRRHAPSSIGGTRIGVGAADEGFFSGCGLPNRAMLRPPAPRPHGLAFPDVKTPVIWRVSAAAANREATMDQESLRLFTQRRKTEPTISSGFSYKARATLIGQNDLSSAAREALEFQGGELGSHFEATLTKQVAEELLGKCTELGLWVAAMALRTELKRSK